MAKENISEKLKELRSNGITVYSISRLNNFNQCKLGYYYTYVLKNTCLECGYVADGIIAECPECHSVNIGCDRGKDSIYGIMGGHIHDCLQNICDGNGGYQDMVDTYNTELNRCTLQGIKFPSESIGVSWQKDMTHFISNFSLPYNTTTTERGFITNIDGVYIQGFIDLMTPNVDSLDIIDWKTSSKFTDKKLLHAGRQLVLYKIAIEKEFGIPVNEVMWYMLKYVNVEYDGKVKMCNRGKWVKEISNLIKTQLKKLGMAEFLIPMMIDKAIEENTIDNMPQEVKDRFKLSDCIVKYNITDELINETKQYIVDTVKQIESLDNDIEKYDTCDIEKENFFCATLCSHSDKCRPYREWLDKNKDNFKKKY